MYSANVRVFLVCASRTKLLKRLCKANQVLNCVYIKYISSTVHRQEKKPSISNLFTPVNIEPCQKLDKVGEELSGNLKKPDLLQIINKFCRSTEVKALAAQNDIDENVYQKGLSSFRKYCLLSESLPADLHVTLSDIVRKAGNVLDIFPYFLRHVREMYPFLNCMEDLKKVGDVREPANWFPETRNMKRKFYYHCGPTNSGKTYEAIQSYFKANSGIYCAPLKLLAVEVFQKANSQGTPCDLITGEEVILNNPSGEQSSHISCTIEMCPLEKSFDVAVIDEIQMLRDPQRGWAWTRALLGLKANEIHICGEEAAVHIVDSILCTTGEKLIVKNYERLTKLHIDSPLELLSRVQPGDCIVCFNKADIYLVAKSLEEYNHEVAIIYGSLPPRTKLSQCENFNNPDHPCNVLVATDAIGMGLNLNIRRIIFYSLVKVSTSELGETEKRLISVSQALQIAGRAGRFGSKYKEGFVTTYREKDFKTLQLLLSQKPERISHAGLQPTPDQIELFSYYLPKSSLSELIDIFCSLCTVDDSLYFMSDLKEMKYLAQLLDHVPLPLKEKYVFCCAPVNRKNHFLSVIFIEFAKLYSLNQVADAKWVSQKINWPLKEPKNVRELSMLETYHDALDLYLWLSYRFQEIYPDAVAVRQMQTHIASLIQYGVGRVKKFMTSDSEESAEAKRIKNEEW